MVGLLVKKQEFVLRLYDYDLVGFTVELGKEVGFGKMKHKLVATFFTKGLEYLLPKGLKELGMGPWLAYRMVPYERENYDLVLNTLGNVETVVDVINKTFLISLNDSYWVVPVEKKDLTFRDVSLYTSKFELDVMHAAFGKEVLLDEGIDYVISPEYTTGGMLKKCWMSLPSGDIRLFKAETSGAINIGLEPYNEYYVSKLAEYLGLDSVAYDLRQFKGEMVSECNLFTTEDISFVPMWIAEPSRKFNDVMETFGVEALADMLVFDALICNVDRHMGNFGMLCNSLTGEYISPAPLFDYGMSLMYNLTDDDLLRGGFDVDEYVRTVVSAFGKEPVDLLQGLVGPKQRKMLRRLLRDGFRFERHENYNLAAKRLRVMADVVKHQARRILNG